MNKKEGFIKLILIFLIVAGIISYFNIDLDKVFSSESAAGLSEFWNVYTKPVLFSGLKILSDLLQKLLSFLN